MRHKPRTLTPSQERWLFVGLLLQPFVAGGVAFVLFRLLLLDRAGRTLAGSTPDDPGGAAFAVAISTGIVAFMATLLLALPAVVWLLLRQGTVSLRVAVLVGLSCGAFTYAAFAIAAGGTYGVAGFVRGLTFALLTGATSATTFWAVALRERQPSSAG